jgi:hypothetical protein
MWNTFCFWFSKMIQQGQKLSSSSHKNGRTPLQLNMLRRDIYNCNSNEFLTVPELRRLVAGFSPRRPVFDPRSGHVGFVVDKVALGQVFSEFFDFPCQFSFHRLLYHLSSGAGTIGQILADVPSGLSLTQPQQTKKKKLS